MANVITADWDEMLFEQREKSYGAYLLRKQYPNTLFKATLFTILISSLIPLSQSSLMLALFGITHLETTIERVKHNDPITLSSPPPELERAFELPPPPLPPKPKITTVVFQIPEPSPKEELSEKHTITDVKELQAAPLIGLKEITGESNVFEEFETITEEYPEVIVEKSPRENEFIYVDEVPKPINLETVKQAILFPQNARDAAIEGNVIVRVLVDTDGSYLQHKILNGVHPLLEKAVEKQLPRLRFTPAIQGGKPILFWVNIPFRFKLQS